MAFYFMQEITFFLANSSLSCPALVEFFWSIIQVFVLNYFINAGYKVRYGFNSNLIILLLELHSLLQSSSVVTLRSIQSSGMSSWQLHTLFKVTACSVAMWILFY
jgi:hypothetical protein